MFGKGNQKIRNDVYSVADQYCLPGEQAGELVRTFCDSDLSGNLESLPHAVGVLQAVYRAGIPVTVISTFGSQNTQKRIDNLHKEFGDIFEDIICLDMDCSKLATLLSFEEGCTWVEDKYDNAVLGLSARHLPFVYSASYNCDTFTILPRLDDWRDLAF
jgi:hypothetical protein